MNRRALPEPTTLQKLRNRADKLEDQIDELNNSYGQGAWKDGLIRDAIAARVGELAGVRAAIIVEEARS